MEVCQSGLFLRKEPSLGERSLMQHLPFSVERVLMQNLPLSFEGSLMQHLFLRHPYFMHQS